MGSTYLDQALNLIRRFEGCRLAPYQDSAGFWTVGWGCRWLSNGQPVTGNTPELTPNQADDLLKTQVAKLAAGVNAILPSNATDGQRTALISFAWNEGLPALKHSTLLRLFNSGNIQGAADQFKAWVYANGRRLPGLVTRREIERETFLGLASSSGTV